MKKKNGRISTNIFYAEKKGEKSTSNFYNYDQIVSDICSFD